MKSVMQKWHPVTNDYGLVRAPLSEVVAALSAWHSSFGTNYSRSLICVSLDSAFTSLLPLANSKMRKLFIQTKSDWTACFQNGIQGSDPFPAMSFLAQKHEWLAMRICATQENAVSPAVIWEVYASALMGGDSLSYRRSIAAVNDGGRWTFDSSGKPFEFEQLDAYTRKRVRDRFTKDMLDEYLGTFGIRAFDDDFFDVSSIHPAILLQQTTNGSSTPEFSLEEVVAGQPWKK
jgi:hypothetical protein